MDNKGKIKCIACSIFKNILEENDLFKENSIEIEYLTSMLHMHPEKLDEKLNKILSGINSQFSKAILLYGDCSPGMNELQNYNSSRIKGINCIEILLDENIYHNLRKEGAFFLLPEWTEKWKEVFQFELGLNEEIGRQLLQEYHTKFIYINTKQAEIPWDLLKEISAYFGLPFEVIEIDKNVLVKKMKTLIQNIEYE